MTRKTTNPGNNLAIDRSYPAITEFVRNQGWIEIGDQEGVGFRVRALDQGGLVYESKKPKTLAQAMHALEKDIARNREL